MSDSRSWTAQQRQAIQTTGRGLLVSAAAGSGKTSVLSERCCYLVCDAEKRCGVGQLLVVTFTESAAAEMKHRIEQALRQRASAADDEQLRRQIALVEHAHISTVHGFCHRLLRQHYHRLGLDPLFRVMDGEEALLLRGEVARELFLDRYESDESGEFQRFIDGYGDGRDERLCALVVSMHEMLCSLVDPREWMRRAASQLEEGAALPLEQSDLGRAYLSGIGGQLAAMHADCVAGLSAIAAMPGFSKYVQHMQTLEGMLEAWRAAAARGYDELVAAVRGTRLRVPNVATATPGRDTANALLRKVHDAMMKGSIHNNLTFTAAEWRQGLRLVAPHASLLLDLVREFERRYRAAKDAARALDFSDLERFTLRLLRDELAEGLAPSAVARACRRQFEHVLVDEYQDINEVQDAILQLLSRDGANLFCVGDVKQSIYRFRLAEPARFLERQEQFSKPGAAGQVIDLQSNFRSRKPLLDALNQLFERLMTRDAVDIEYDQSQRLRAGLAYPDVAGQRCFAGSPIELHFLPTKFGDADADDDELGDMGELSRADIEATLVARRIDEFLGRGQGPRMSIMDRGPDGTLVWRPLEFRDIVVLLRSTRHQAEAYAAVLGKHGIPAFNTAGAGYFDSIEVRDLLSLLALLDNQQQDFAMAAVLRSPLGNLANADDALARIRVAYPAGDGARRGIQFHRAVLSYAQERDDALAQSLREFLSQLARWRELAQRQPIADVIWRIYDDTGCLAFCNGLEHGQQRCANLLQLHQRARQFGEFSRQGLARFIDFLHGLADQARTAQACELGEADNVVRIMSVHHAKGLEFPVVFVPDLGKRINTQDWTGHILADRHALLGMSVVDQQKQVRYPSLASTMVQDRLRQQGLAEELRVLYVATTRAREHLVLIGSAKPESADAWAKRWTGHAGPLPREAVLGVTTMLDWIGPAATAIADAQAFSLTVHTEEDLRQWAAATPAPPAHDELRHRLVDLRPLRPEPAPNAATDAVIAALTTPYPHTPYVALPASTSVTAWTKHEPKSAPAQAAAGTSLARALDLPRFLQQHEHLAATERGTAVHVVLQHLDFARPCDRDDLECQIASLLERKLVAPAQARVVDHAAIEWLLSTSVGQLVRRHARQLLRELPINYPLSPQRFGAPPSGDPLDRVMLRGRLDLVIPAPDGWHLLDYKTDRVEGDALRQRVDLYAPQVELYREVLQRIVQVPIAGIHLAFLHPRQMVSL